MLTLRRLAACTLIALSGACHADELTDRAIAAFKAAEPTLQITAKDANELQVKQADGNGATVYLDNLRKTCNLGADACASATADFAKVLIASFGREKSATTFTLDKLYPVLRKAGYAAQAAKIAKEPGQGVVMQPFGPDVELLFVIDSPNSLEYVTLDEQKKAGLADAALLAAASGNASHLPALKPIPVPHRDGLFALVFNDSLGSARMFDAALWTRLEADAGGPMAVATPTRDLILFTRLDDAAHVDALRVLARNIASREAYGVSGEVFRRDGAGWRTVDAR